MHVKFSLTGLEEFDSYPVSELMGVEAEKCWRKGEPSRNGPRRWSSWSFSVGRGLDLEEDELLAMMREVVVPKSEELKRLPAEIQIGMYAHEDTFPGAEISREHLRWIVELGASLDVGSV